MTDTSDGRTRGEQEMQEQLRLLGGKFLLRTRDQVTQLRQLIQGLESARDPLTALEEIAHKIHGSGAMFGFADISARGGEIETLAESLLALNGPVDSPARAQLSLLADRLEHAVQAALAAR